MAIQLSTEVRNARLDAIESTTGTSPYLKIFAGTMPANCGTSDGGNTVLATLALPSDWMAAASGGSKSMSGTWSDSSADATGTASYFRIFKNDGTTCVMQGSVATSGGDMTVITTSFVATQAFSISSFTLTEGAA